MTAQRFAELTSLYPSLRIAVVGDFFLDRYLLIDAAKAETSIETGLPVYNVVEVVSQPGAAGTIVNNLVALGIGEIPLVGFRGDDGEGYELQRALASKPGVRLEHLATSTSRRTPVYCKPMLIEVGKTPRELNRLDSKNWSPTPPELQHELANRLRSIAGSVDAILLLEQVDLPRTGVVTLPVMEAAQAAMRENPKLVVLADSRQGLAHFPPFAFKMNAAELARMTDGLASDLETVKHQAADLARRNAQPVFITLAEHGMIGATADEPPVHVHAHAVRGEIDIVGAGDAVAANLAAAIAAGASIAEAMQIAMAAASIVIHQLGTTGTASTEQIAGLLAPRNG
jgi:rfaE bifunctional protein kinase chain/domain